MKHAGVIPTLRSKYETLQPFLNERVRRLWSATEAMGLGHGGIAALTEATGMSRTTISHAIQEIQDQRESPGSTLPIQRSRRPGAGRKRLIKQDPAGSIPEKWRLHLGLDSIAVGLSITHHL